MKNQAMMKRNGDAYRAMRTDLMARYPERQFLVMRGGEVVADSNDFFELHKRFRDCDDTMIVRVGEELFEYADIL